jgi:CheY-like chemotaxis protein
MESLNPYLERLFDLLMAAQSAAAPPEHILEAARREVLALHRATDRGDRAAALGHLRALAGLLGLDWADLAPEIGDAAAAPLLVVDGHAEVRQALARRLRRVPGIGSVHTAGTLREAVVLARAHTPHVAICDPRTVGGDSAGVVRRICREVGHVLVYSTSLPDHERQVLLRAGAAAVLLKGSETAHLLVAVVALARLG